MLSRYESYIKSEMLRKLTSGGGKTSERWPELGELPNIHHGSVLEFGKSVVHTFTPQKSFGTILVGIGFASYLVPLLASEVKVLPSHKDKSHVKYTNR